ncbi:MAG TPA: PDZ domain-containing protein, partial [Candidatus Nanoarchaeia archaeon]|nr:PDZ domain-containing protein [Candidatus Nanoarchaeia archaeon]
MNKFLTLRVWILLIALVLAVIAISPNPWAEGIEIVSIDPSSDAAQNGLSVGQILVSIGDQEITSLQDVSDTLVFFAYPAQDVVVKTTDEDVTYSVTNDLGFIVDENLTVIASKVNVTLG